MKHPATKGIYLKKGIYWLQLPMVEGLRPKPISLQTKGFDEAIKKAAIIRALPNLAPTGAWEAEITNFLAYKVARKEYSKTTAKAKGYTLRAFAARPGTPPPHLTTTDHLQAYYDAELAAHNPATAHKRLMNVRALFKHLLRVEKKVRINPAVGVSEVAVPDGARKRFCDEALQDKLINECPREDLKLVLILGFDAGLRKNEIIQAVAAWFRMEQRCLDLQPTPTMPFNKYKKPRIIPMRQRLYDFIKGYGLRKPFMLRPDVKQGKDTYRYDFDLPLQTYTAAQGVPWVTAHVLRHTFASLLVQGNTNIFKVATWMGDTVATVQKHYAHLIPRDSDIELHRVKTRKPKLRSLKKAA